MFPCVNNSFPIAPPTQPLPTDPLFDQPSWYGNLSRIAVSGPMLLAVALAAWVLLPVLTFKAGFFPCISGYCPPRVATPETTLSEHLLWVDYAAFPTVAVLSIVAIVRKNMRGFAIAALCLTAVPGAICLQYWTPWLINRTPLWVLFALLGVFAVAVAGVVIGRHRRLALAGLWVTAMPALAALVHVLGWFADWAARLPFPRR
jgi:hypothetical protein